MSALKRNTFKKNERLCSRILMDRLFQGNNRSISAFPLRAVFLPVESSVQEGVSVLISVPKKRFHDAVDRNRAKRLMREAFRLLVKDDIMPANTEWVFIARRGIGGKKVGDVMREMRWMCGKC